MNPQPIRRAGEGARIAAATLRRDPAVTRAVWLLGLAAFVTSVTIASIAPQEEGVAGADRGRSHLPPPQTVVRGTVAPAAATPAAEQAVVATVLGSRPASDAVQSDPGASDGEWLQFTVRRGDTFSGILRRAGLDLSGLTSTLLGNVEVKALHRLRPGDVIRVRASVPGRIEEIVYDIDRTATLRLVRQIDGFSVTRESRSFETRLAYVSGRIESTLFEDGQKAGLSDTLIMRLVEIFGWDIDFALDIRPGDTFSVIHEENYWLGQKVSDGSIVAAEFVNQGQSYRALGHRDEKGFISYYTPQGMSVRRSFLRTPVKFSRISSGYTLRRFHPILKSWGSHKGVDYAAPVGTPVRATADGRVLALGWHGGYGKRIVIKHGGSYSTLYAHLSRYHPPLRPGSYVEQGQIIGFVGSTGLATGPHLHYEFQVDGAHHNPLTFKFPGARPISAEYRQAFMQHAQIWGARLDLIGPTITLASGQ